MTSMDSLNTSLEYFKATSSRTDFAPGLRFVLLKMNLLINNPMNLSYLQIQLNDPEMPPSPPYGVLAAVGFTFLASANCFTLERNPKAWEHLVASLPVIQTALNKPVSVKTAILSAAPSSPPTQAPPAYSADRGSFSASPPSAVRATGSRRERGAHYDLNNNNNNNNNNNRSCTDWCGCLNRCPGNRNGNVEGGDGCECVMRWDARTVRDIVPFTEIDLAGGGMGMGMGLGMGMFRAGNANHGRGGGGGGGGGGFCAGCIRRLAPYKKKESWVTLIMLVTSILYLVEMILSESFFEIDSSVLYDLGGKWAPDVEAGEYQRLIAPMFLHTGFFHFAINMSFLAQMGWLAEKRWGALLFLSVYLIGGLGGNYLSCIANEGALSVGASTSISAMVGGSVAFLLMHKEDIPFFQQECCSLTTVVIFNMIIGFTSSSIDNWSHLGGLITGFLFLYTPAIAGLSPLLNNTIRGAAFASWLILLNALLFA